MPTASIAPVPRAVVRAIGQVFWLVLIAHRTFPTAKGVQWSSRCAQDLQLREQLRFRTGFPLSSEASALAACSPSVPDRAANVPEGACADTFVAVMSYTFRPVATDDASIASMTALLAEVFPSATHFTPEVVRWQYRLNPDGEAVGFNAWAEGVLAAHYVTIPLVARVNGKEERGLLSLNTATHPAHQGKGLFTQLANATYDAAAKKGYGFVIGVANANSTHGFTKKLGFQLVSPLKAMVGLGPIAVKTSLPCAYERVWSDAALAWRLSHPLNKYKVLRTKGSDLIHTERRQFGASLLLAAMAPGSVNSLNVLNSAGPLRIWVGCGNSIDWRWRPYVNIPMRFRPSPLNLIFKDLTGAGRTLIAQETRFQAIDFDTL